MVFIKPFKMEFTICTCNSLCSFSLLHIVKSSWYMLSSWKAIPITPQVCQVMNMGIHFEAFLSTPKHQQSSLPAHSRCSHCTVQDCIVLDVTATLVSQSQLDSPQKQVSKCTSHSPNPTSLVKWNTVNSYPSREHPKPGLLPIFSLTSD